MSIIIHNISGDAFDEFGLNKYQVRINQKVIAEFDHVRSLGLAACLRMAAEAVEQADRLEVTNDKELLEYIIKTAHAF